MTFVSCDIGDAVTAALAAADGKNLELLGANIARQCATRGLIDELYVHLAPVMLGDGVRVFDCPGANRCAGSAFMTVTLDECLTYVTGPRVERSETLLLGIGGAADLGG